jgi:hypothetical protein
MRYRQERLPVVDRVHRGEERVQPRAGPVLHPTAGQCRGHRSATQLDRQPVVAPHHPPGGLWSVDGLRRGYGHRRSADPEHHQRLLTDRAPHRNPDGTRADHRDPRQSNDCHDRSYYSGEYIYDTLAITDRDSYRVNDADPPCTHRKASRTSPPKRRTPNSSPRTSSGPSPKDANPGCPAGRSCRPCESWTASNRTGTPNNGAQLIPGRPFCERVCPTDYFDLPCPTTLIGRQLT